MIINTGGRTDTVQHYTEWLLKRFSEGYVLSRNPLFPNKVVRYELTPDKVDCVVFCSKDYRPILPRLHEITDRFNTYFHYTITAYGKDVEPGVPSIGDSIDTLVEFSEIVGKGRIARRYDPTLLIDRYTVEKHMEMFESMAKTIYTCVDRCIFSFVEMYRKLIHNMLEIIPILESQMDGIAKGLGNIASINSLKVQTDLWDQRRLHKILDRGIRMHALDILGCIRDSHPDLLTLYESIYINGDRSYWSYLDSRMHTFCIDNGLDYATKDDSVSRDFDDPPAVVNYFFHERIKKSSRGV